MEEEKQLDFNQPLLSVRRFSSQVVSETDNKRKTNEGSLVRLPPPVPPYKSDLKSGPVSHPGTVPFIWEQTPGIPKDESKSPTQAFEQLVITPNLPPGRVLRVKPQGSDQVSKVASVTQYVASLDKNVTKHESQKVSAGSDDGDEAYQDALDTLSRTESFFMNCSVSGLSGLDDQELQSSESLSRDQQARNFMIDRFLPAAKAIASETPQYMSRKPLVVQEQPRQVKKVVSRRRNNPHRQIVLSHYTQTIGSEGSEDEDDDYNESETQATKVCGLFPRFCILNPIPGLRMHDKVLSSAAHGMQAKSSASQSETRKEHARIAYGEKKSVDSQFGFKEEKLRNGIDPHRRGFSKSSAYESTQCDFGCASPVVEKTLYVDSVHKSKSHSSSYSFAMEGQTNHRWDDVETLEIKSLKEAMLEDTQHLSIVDDKATSQPSTNMQMDITNQRFLKPEEQGSDLNQNSARSSPKVLLNNLVTSNQVNFDGTIQNHGSWRSSRLAGDVEVDLKSLLATSRSIHQECSKVVSDGNTDFEGRCLKLPLALPSPKAPSESWLKRTLPTISSRNICSRSSSAAAAAHIHTHSQTAKTASFDPKWETIVKSSKELLTPIPED